MKKVCSKCGENKEFSEYHKEKTGRFGLRSDCKSCNAKKGKKNYQKNKERYTETNKKWREKNKERLKESKSKYRAENKDKIKEYNKKYNIQNKEKIKKQLREKYASDPLHRLRHAVRHFCFRVTRAVKQDKEMRSLEYLGCSLEEFKTHIESLWLEGMSWENHGDWHIDHIVPLDHFVKNSDDPWEANHYKNLQPLWAEDNFSKGNKT